VCHTAKKRTGRHKKVEMPKKMAVGGGEKEEKESKRTQLLT